MICRRFLSFVFVASLAFFSGLFITTQNSFALDDIVKIYNSSSSFQYTNSAIFSNLNASTFSQYSYLVIDYSPLPSYNSALAPLFYIKFNCINSVSVISSLTVFSLSYNSDSTFSCTSNSSRLPVFANNFDPSNLGSSTLTFTLTNNPPVGSSTVPTGNIDITSNGTYDVTDYASATVNVPAEVIQGDYHDDLVNIQKSIIVCGAILLVLYFFYCIYRLIIKNSGVH